MVSIHAPREGCDLRPHLKEATIQGVSIHAPREGCDGGEMVAQHRIDSFNSRTPGGVRLLLTLRDVSTMAVSIHAPREGCDHYVH